MRLRTLLIVGCFFAFQVVAAPPKPATPAPAKVIKERILHGETISHYSKGTIVRQFTLRPVYGPSDKSTRARLNGQSSIPGPMIGTTRVYGSHIFLIGYKLQLGMDLNYNGASAHIGQASINGILMEVWKPDSKPTVREKCLTSLGDFGYR